MTRLQSIREGAETLRVSTFTVRRLMDTGEIDSVTIGSRRLISEEEIERVAREGAGNPRRRKERSGTARKRKAASDAGGGER
jgi:excisionase family DNA binding protein